MDNIMCTLHAWSISYDRTLIRAHAILHIFLAGLGTHAIPLPAAALAAGESFPLANGGTVRAVLHADPFVLGALRLALPCMRRGYL
jgi:hypothetical protein